MALEPTQRVENIVQAHIQSEWLAIQSTPDRTSRHRRLRQELHDFLLQQFDRSSSHSAASASKIRRCRVALTNQKAAPRASVLGAGQS